MPLSDSSIYIAKYCIHQGKTDICLCLQCLLCHIQIAQDISK